MLTTSISTNATNVAPIHTFNQLDSVDFGTKFKVVEHFYKQEKKKTYKVSTSGTYYHVDTPDQVVDCLEHAMNSSRSQRPRVRLFYGESNAIWHESYDVTGEIGRSGGIIKSPLLIPRANSFGGPAILTHCIIGIQIEKRFVYASSTLKSMLALYSVRATPENSEYHKLGYRFSVFYGEELLSNHTSQSKAKRFCDFMSGTRSGL